MTTYCVYGVQAIDPRGDEFYLIVENHKRAKIKWDDVTWKVERKMSTTADFEGAGIDLENCKVHISGPGDEIMNILNTLGYGTPGRAVLPHWIKDETTDGNESV